MKKVFRMFLVIVALALPLSAYADAAKSIVAGSEWQNERNSTLHFLSIAPNGKITGTYVNRAKDFPRCRNIKYPVTGWLYGNAITFTVIWRAQQESCQSITAWTGFLYNGQIHTLWQLVTGKNTDTSQILQGSDTFHRIAMKKHKR